MHVLKSGSGEISPARSATGTGEPIGPRDRMICRFASKGLRPESIWQNWPRLTPSFPQPSLNEVCKVYSAHCEAIASMRKVWAKGSRP